VRCIILAGGRGTRFSEETINKPKPMIEISGQPILFHIMNYFSKFSVKEFTITLGYQGNIIKDWLRNFEFNQNSFHIDLNSGETSFIESKEYKNWSVLALDTGLNSLTATRVRQAIENSNDEDFFVTYGDGLCDVDLNQLLQFHMEHKKLVTVTAVKPPARFGHLELDGDKVLKFTEKSQSHEARINGGFFVFNRKVLDYFVEQEEALESGPLTRVTQQGEMRAFIHDGFWQNMDTQRDRELLEASWNKGIFS
jgi:glucose-1-phosphate cytidylyltransferase